MSTRDEGRTELREKVLARMELCHESGCHAGERCAFCRDAADEIIEIVRADPSGEVGEEIEDMRARKDAAYTERNRCVVAMAHMARALGWTVYASEHDPGDTEWEGDWRAILVVESPEGQLTWHFHDSQRAMLEGFDLRLYEWDGHDTPEKYRRLEESLARLRRTPESTDLEGTDPGPTGDCADCGQPLRFVGRIPQSLQCVNPACRAPEPTEETP